MIDGHCHINLMRWGGVWMQYLAFLFHEYLTMLLYQFQDSNQSLDLFLFLFKNE